MKDKARSKKKTSELVLKKLEEAIAGLPAAAKEKKVSKSLKKASRVIAKTVRDAAAKKAKANKKASKKISKKNKGKKSSKSVAKVKGPNVNLAPAPAASNNVNTAANAAHPYAPSEE